MHQFHPPKLHPAPTKITTIDSMLSSPVTSPRFHTQSPTTFFSSSSNLPLSPRATTLRRLSCAATATASSLYDILGIPPAASSDDIKAAYRHLARSCHPDAAGPSATDAFIRLHDAYSTLSDPNKRADYDRTLFFRQPYTAVRFNGLSSSTSTSFPGAPRKNWESDQCW